MSDSANVLVYIRKHLQYLNPALARVGAYILKNPNKIKLQKIKEVAKSCKVSESTVTRFVKEIHVNSFHDLKIAIAETTTDESKVAESKKRIYDNVRQMDSIEDIIDKIAYVNVDTLQETTKLISPANVAKAVEAIQKAKIIKLFSVGPSSVAAQNAFMTFYRVGKICSVNSDQGNESVTAAWSNDCSLAIGICNSGQTKTTVTALKIAKQSGTTTICITSAPNSPITKYADIIFYTPARRSNYFQETMTSRMAQILVIDILYASFVSKYFKQSSAHIEQSSKILKGIFP